MFFNKLMDYELNLNCQHLNLENWRQITLNMEDNTAQNTSHQLLDR